MSDETVRLQQEIDQLRAKLGELMLAGGTGYYHSDAAQHNWFNLREIPQEGLDRGVVKFDNQECTFSRFRPQAQHFLLRERQSGGRGR